MCARFRDIEQLPQAHYEIDVGWDYLDATLKGFADDYGLDMEPDFQRGHVWTREQQIAYVEWILMGGESGKVVMFNCPNWNGSPGPNDRIVLVDGKQRIEAVQCFMHGKIPAFGHFKNEYTDSARSHLVGLKFRIASLETRAQELKWYLAINSGGTPHSKEEIERVNELLRIEEEKSSGK